MSEVLRDFPEVINPLPHRDSHLLRVFANRADPGQGLLCLLMEI